MPMSYKLKKITIEDWRKLGFFYKRDDESMKWIFVASKYGLEDFPCILEKLSLKLQIDGYHDHIGPYAYLSIRSESRLVIDKDGIRGNTVLITELANRIRDEIKKASVDTVINLKNITDNEGDYSIDLIIREYGFDPATEDSDLWQ